MEIGKRQRVDIRNIWRKETEFSNWLVSDDGIELIAQDLGVQIENPRRESRPGDFPCDIVGHMLGNEEHIVVIENQFHKTNHDHLGKLLTYAAVHQAMTGIWIAEQASDDHRQVIDWLNQNTPPTVSLYLAELKAYQIGNSAAGPQLDVVCRPNMSVKMTHTGQSPAERERHEWRIKLWEDIQAEIKKRKPPFNLQRPGPDHWSSISIGRANFYLNMLLTPKNESVGIDLYITCPWKDSAFSDLQEQSEQIEHELGATLQWMPLAGKKTARILFEAKIDPKVSGNHGQVLDWFAVNSVKMFNVFQKRVLNLVPPLESNS